MYTPIHPSDALLLRILLSLMLSCCLALSSAFAQHQTEEVYTSSSSTNVRYNHKNETENLNIEIDGTISLAPDDKSIASISPGGFIKIKKTTFGNTRELLARNTGGTISYEYKEGGRNVAFEPAGRTWMADVLQEIVRTTTIGAESRVDRFYQQGGTQAVLRETGNIKSDHVKAKYLELLLKKNIPDSEVPGFIETIGKEVNSDFYRYEIFKNNSERLLANSQHMGLYLNAINTVKSDHYKSELVKLAFNYNIPAQFNQQALQLMATINSDHYKIEVLERMLKKQKLSDEQLQFLLNKHMQTIKSDHYRSELLARVLSTQNQLSPAGVNHMIGSIGQISSSHYVNESLKKLVKTHSLSSSNYEQLFGVLNKIKSDHYKSEFMRLLVKEPQFGEHFDLFLQESQTMGSDHNRSEVLKAALNGGSLSDDQLAKLVASTTSISSDHYKSELLLKICAGSRSDKVKQAVQAAAKSISSTHYYGSVMKCIQ